MQKKVSRVMRLYKTTLSGITKYHVNLEPEKAFELAQGGWSIERVNCRLSMSEDTFVENATIKEI